MPAPRWQLLLRSFLLSASLLWMASRTAGAQDNAQDDSTDDLEQLINAEVTTGSRIPEKRSRVPAAVYVITQEDIRRSGATSIPEALRLAPGIQVSRIDSSKWAIGIRGFSSRLARSMLVLIDGRAVYSPLFAGTYWEVQDTLLEDVDRIEIIYGPGGILWGSNAVNGIINVITKDARSTQGPLVALGGGSEMQGFAGFRYGSDAGPNSFYRVYGKYFTRDAAFHSDGHNFDDWRMGQVGFRFDRTGASESKLTVQGDLYKGPGGQRAILASYTAPFSQPIEKNAEMSGGNLLARWEGFLGDQAQFTIQTYYDRTNRIEPAFREVRDTADFDLQLRLNPFARQEVVWGAGYRASSGKLQSVATLRLEPERRTDHLMTGFLQDDVEVIADRLHLIAGAKIEHNGYSGFENQPSIRLLWTPSASHTVVASVARGVRTPSRVEHDMELNSFFIMVTPDIPAFLRLTPNKEFVSEKLLAYEFGYRIRPATPLYLAFSSFFNTYQDLVSNEVRTPFLETNSTPPHVIVPVIWGNGMRGHAHGMEFTSDWRANGWFRLNGSYSFLRINIHKSADSLDNGTERSLEGGSPRHQARLQSSINLREDLELNWMFRYVSSLPSQNIRSFTTSDARLAWRSMTGFELSVVGQNLHSPQHLEVSGGSGIQRGVYGKLTWQR